MNGPAKKVPPIPASPLAVEPRRTSPPPLPPDVTGERGRTSPPLSGEAGDRYKTSPPLPGTEPAGERHKTLRQGAVQAIVFEMVRAVLQRYLGPATVEGMLTTACKHSGVSPETMRVRELDLLLAELMPSIRTLCDAEKQPRLLSELDQLHQLHG